MSAAIAFPRGDAQWKDPAFVGRWKKSRRAELEKKWGSFHTPLLDGVPLAALPGEKLSAEVLEMVTWENESLSHRFHRLEEGIKRPKPKNNRSHHAVPALIAKDGEWFLTPIANRATAATLEQAKTMYEGGLDKKAQRQVACGILGGEVKCKTGHAFFVGYECGNRYCPDCGPRAARRLFAKQAPKILFASTRLFLCGVEDCKECNQAIENKTLPHWPPPRGIKPQKVCAKIDFTLRNTGKVGPDLMRQLNVYIRRFFRAIEKRFGIERKDYGVAWCDELGAGNTNAHAHGIYVGPWLPQSKKGKELSALWSEITGGSFILSIKYARVWGQALYHALKYPAKFVNVSTPGRRADLEVIFHRVRRFHSLAAFYNPEHIAEVKPPKRNCPLCDAKLFNCGSWQSISTLKMRGLRNLSDVEKEVAKLRGMEGQSPPLKTIPISV